MKIFCWPQLGCSALLMAVQIVAPARAQAEPTVEAGKSMGRVRLGFTRAQVHKALGKPSKTLKLKGGLTDDVWRAKGSANKLEILYKAGKVVQMEATSPVFVTAGGLSTRSSLSTLDHALNPKRFLTYSYDLEGDSGYLKFYVDQVQEGIAFESETWQDVVSPEIRFPTIIIHRKGVSVIPDQGGEFRSSTASIPVEN